MEHASISPSEAAREDRRSARQQRLSATRRASRPASSGRQQTLMGADQRGIAIYRFVRGEGNGRKADFPARSTIPLAGS